MDYRLTGANMNQEDLPWWAVSILGWMAMVKALQESAMKGWAEATKVKLEYEPPHKIYEFYKHYCAASERESRSAG